MRDVHPSPGALPGVRPEQPNEDQDLQFVGPLSQALGCGTHRCGAVQEFPCEPPPWKLLVLDYLKGLNLGGGEAGPKHFQGRIPPVGVNPMRPADLDRALPSEVLRGS